MAFQLPKTVRELLSHIRDDSTHPDFSFLGMLRP